MSDENKLLEPGKYSSLSDISGAVKAQVDHFLEQEPKNELRRKTQEQAKVSLQVIARAIEGYTFEELAFSFNGGKDCLVLLILLLASIRTSPPDSLQAIYVTQGQSFPEVDAFVHECTERYYLTLNRLQYPLKEAFRVYLDDRTHIKAVFVGTRRTDPHSENLQHFDPTDHGWPLFMRIHPVIDWHYVEVWDVSGLLDLADPVLACSQNSILYTVRQGLYLARSNHRHPPQSCFT